MRIRRSSLIFVGSVVIAAIPFVFLPNPGATLADFPVATESISNSRIVRYEKSRSDYFELEVSAKSGRIYFLRQPDSTLLAKYLKSLPTEGTITVHYRKTPEGLQILDIRDDQHTYISFETFMSDSRQKRTWILVAAFAFFLIGLFARAIERGARIDA